MKHDTLFVDEATKKTMEFINEGIIDSVSGALRSTDVLKTIEKLADEISGKFGMMQKTSDHILEKMEGLERLPENILSSISKDVQKNRRELTKAISEAQSAQLQEIDSLKIAIANVLSKLGEAATRNNNAVTGQIKSLEKKIDIITENQNHDSRRLEEIAEKLDYLSLPFYKRIMKKPRKGNDSLPDTNKEDK